MVLVVEDDDTVSTTIEIALLSIPEVIVSVLSSAKEALTFFDAKPSSVAALITDLNMVHMSGFELITQIRAQDCYTTLPILVISGDSDPETPARLRRLGVNEYLQKPCSPVEIRRTLRMLLSIP
jgi:two-component system chemotaxis response regulator CheY